MEEEAFVLCCLRCHDPGFAARQRWELQFSFENILRPTSTSANSTWTFLEPAPAFLSQHSASYIPETTRL
ncbi:hypothetical protein PtB15_10B76 [Puccinia triticina]|nr:hypothetical protein PtB15_10B76 [Puccinia triticina]